MSGIIIHSDGAARGNPGPAGAGALLENEKGEVVAKVCKYLGEATNNQAEYTALILGLEEAEKNGATRISVFCDSELVVKQVKGEYKVKNAGLRPLFQEVMKHLRKIGVYTISHIPREENKKADELANLAIDSQAY